MSYTPPTGGIYFYNQNRSTPSTPQPVTINNKGSYADIQFHRSVCRLPFTTNSRKWRGGRTLAAGESCTIEVSSILRPSENA